MKMEKKYDVIALGELLIDFTMNGQSEQGNNLFEACPGGAPCNVLALLNKMGKKTAFIGKVGKDQFGTLLRETITEAGIDASRLMTDDAGEYNAGIRTYIPGRGQGVLVLPQSGGGYDAHGRGRGSGVYRTDEDLPLRNAFDDARRSEGSDEKGDAGGERCGLSGIL